MLIRMYAYYNFLSIKLIYNNLTILTIIWETNYIVACVFNPVATDHLAD